MEKAILRCISLWTCDASVILQICHLSFLFRDCEKPLETADSFRKPMETNKFQESPNIETHTRFFVHQSLDSLSTSQQSSHYSLENPLFHGALFAVLPLWPIRYSGEVKAEFSWRSQSWICCEIFMAMPWLCQPTAFKIFSEQLPWHNWFVSGYHLWTADVTPEFYLCRCS